MCSVCCLVALLYKAWIFKSCMILHEVETLQRREVDVGCVQEVRFSGKGARPIEGKEGFYKFLWNNKMKVKDSERQ